MNIFVYSNICIIYICYLIMFLMVFFSIYFGYYFILIVLLEVEINSVVWFIVVSNYKGKNIIGYCIWWLVVLRYYLWFFNKFVCDWYVFLLYVCSAGYFLFIWSNGIVYERFRYFNCYVKGKLSYKFLFY